MEPALVVPRQIWRIGGSSSGNRSIPEESAVALTYNGGTYAVMMTTPQDLEDFAVGFSLNEGIISSAAEIKSMEVVRLDDGVELRMWLSRPKADRLQARRRHIAGPTGVDCAVSIQSRKPCVRLPSLDRVGNSPRSRSWAPCGVSRRIKAQHRDARGSRSGLLGCRQRHRCPGRGRWAS